ncbi:hypothetical protein [Nocardia nova]|uniref:hypothetical protein n=1 Tax=Nocardia nova TaxID=37330 RepID=UPI00189610F2|nr:hypothetical protein [Nocardia nova]MBF6147060.1 hypothetical protein [Nocardia nova]
MSLVQDHADWIRRCEVARIDDRQRVLLEVVLAACDPKSILTRHASGAQSATAALAHLHSALESRARPHRKKGQPYPPAIMKLTSTALNALESLKLVLPPRDLDAAITAVQDLLTKGEAGVVQAGDCHAAATAVDLHAAAVCTTVTAQFAAAWQGLASLDVDRRIALEVATRCVIVDRSHAELARDLRSVLSRGTISVNTVLQVLMPPERTFKIAVIVEGTSHLEGAQALMRPAAALTAIEPGGTVPAWGHGTTALTRLTELVERLSTAGRDWSKEQAREHVVLTFEVNACDVGGAALSGRQQVSELLDQYVAGQRVSEIRLRNETLVYDPISGKALPLTVPAIGSGVARPLTTQWPTALRESLRTAHIARVTEAPTTAAGLCWSALEAMEVKPNTTDTLANALSLGALRQQVLDLHLRTRLAVAATTRVAHERCRAAVATSEQLRVRDGSPWFGPAGVRAGYRWMQAAAYPAGVW